MKPANYGANTEGSIPVQQVTNIRISDESINDPEATIKRSRFIIPTTKDIRTYQLIEWLVPISLLLVFLKILMGPAFLSTTYYMGGSGDPNQYQWYIGWIPYALTHNQPIFVTSAFYYPNTTNLMSYTSVPFLGFTFGWLYPLIGIAATYNLIFIANYFMIFVFGKLTLKLLGINRLFSSIGGLLFTLCPYLSSQELGHLNLYFIGFHFLVGYLIVRLFVSDVAPTWRSGLLFGASMMAIFYISLETCLTIALFIFIVLLVALLIQPRLCWEKLRQIIRPSYVIGVGLPLLLVIPGLINLLLGILSGVKLAPSTGAYACENDLLSFIIPSDVFYVHDAATTNLTQQFSCNSSEWNGYMSIPAIFILFMAIFNNWQNKLIRILSFSGIIMLILSMGPVLHIAGQPSIPLPWWIGTKLPLFHSALPSRFALYMQYLAVILLILAANNYYKKFNLSKGRISFALNIISLLLVALFWFPVHPFLSGPFPKSATIMAQKSVSDNYLKQKKVWFLQRPLNFSSIMGVLVYSESYDTKAANLYGSQNGYLIYPFTLGYYYDADPKIFGSYFESMLPSMGVDEVIFVSTDDAPMIQGTKDEVSEILGAPVYDNQDLAIVWTVPSMIKTDMLTYQYDTLYHAVSDSLHSASAQPLTVTSLVQQGLLPSSYQTSDPQRTAYYSFIRNNTPDEVEISVNVNSLAAKSIIDKYGQYAKTIQYPGYTGKNAGDNTVPPFTVTPGSSLQQLQMTFSLASIKTSKI
jgi:hypothetical protein